MSAYLTELLISGVRFVLTGAFAVLCAFCGVKVREAKNKKAAAEEQ